MDFKNVVSYTECTADNDHDCKNCDCADYSVTIIDGEEHMDHINGCKYRKWNSGKYICWE